MRKRIYSSLAATAAGMVALAGCGSGEAQSGGSASTLEEGPLDAYWAALDTGEEWNEEDYQERERKVQDLVAECMAKEGFEYLPNAPSSGAVFVSDDADGPAWDSLEFAQQYGYGMVDWPGRDDMQETTATEEYTDPNEAYVNSLTESEMNAYYEVLYGKPSDVDELTLEDDPDGETNYEYRWEDSGCWGWADHEVNADQQAADGMWEDPEFTDMFAALEEMSNSIYGDSPQLTELDAQWAACMADGGYDGLTSRNAAQEQLMDEWMELYSSGGSEEWVDPSPEKLQEFQTKEAAQATADWKCADKLDYQKKLHDAYLKAQEEFVAQYKDTLDAMVAKYGNKEKS